jgi:CNT family concentrative nucleoside transporter
MNTSDVFPEPILTSSFDPVDVEKQSVEKQSVEGSEKKQQGIVQERELHDTEELEQDQEARITLYTRFRPFILGGTALLIFGWWVSATVLKATRHRW